MCSRDAISFNMMSLDDKIRIIMAYKKMSPSARRSQLKKSNEQYKKIIKNEKKILAQYLLMQKKLVAVRNAFKLESSVRKMDISSLKVLFLQKILTEWCLRYNSNPKLPMKRLTQLLIREHCEIAKYILNLTSFIPSESWVSSIHQVSMQAVPKNVDKSSLPLSITEITKYVLEQEGISREEAETTYGIILNEEEEILEIDDHQHHQLVPIPSVDDLVMNGLSNEDNTNILINDSVQGDWILKNNHEALENSKLPNEHSYMIIVKNEYNDEGYADTMTNDSGQEDNIINNIHEALQYLKPLEEFLLSQKNITGFELLTQMKLLLFKPEKNS